MGKLLLTKCLRCRGAVIYDKIYGPHRQVLFRHAISFRQITPSCLPTFSKAAKTLSNCSSVWVAM